MLFRNKHNLFLQYKYNKCNKWIVVYKTTETERKIHTDTNLVEIYVHATVSINISLLWSSSPSKIDVTEEHAASFSRLRAGRTLVLIRQVRAGQLNPQEGHIRGVSGK
jgi:hypothetical protein